MATLYITEYATLGRDNAGKAAQIPQEPPVAEQTVAIGGGSVQSAALNIATTVVRLHTDVICSKLFGSNPTATAASGRMAAGTTEYVSVDKQVGLNPALKIAVITNT